MSSQSRSALHATLQPSRSEIIVRLAGVLAGDDVRQLDSLLEVLADATEVPIIVHLAELGGVDPEGAGALVRACDQFRARGRTFGLRCAAPPVQGRLAAAGVNPPMPIDDRAVAPSAPSR